MNLESAGVARDFVDHREELVLEDSFEETIFMVLR